MKKILKNIIGYIGYYILKIFYKKKYITKSYFNTPERVIWGLRRIWFQKILGFNRRIPFPIVPNFIISEVDNLIFDVSDLNNFSSPGCYFQNFNAKIYIGKGTYIAPNVGIITSNHSMDNLDQHTKGKDVVLGKNCWIGMNSVILPGVKIGDKTIVGAGSVVTKSFEEGNLVIAGSPAKIIKKI